MLSAQQIAQYHADGFIVVPGIVDAGTLGALRAAAERIVAGAAQVDQHDAVYDLEPGYMLYWPLNCPHRVENHDCMNVSVTSEHWTRELRNIYAVNYANGLLRNAGLRNLRRQRSGPGMMAKLAFAGAAKFSGTSVISLTASSRTSARRR